MIVQSSKSIPNFDRKGRVLHLEFEAPVGSQIRRYGCGISAFNTEEDLPLLWWSHKQRKWINSTVTEGIVSSGAPCHSHKAFLRHMRKHSDSLVGCTIVYDNRYRGHRVVAKIRKSEG